MLAYVEFTGATNSQGAITGSTHIIPHGDAVRQGNGFRLEVLIPYDTHFTDVIAGVALVSINGKPEPPTQQEFVYSSEIQRGYVFHKLYPTEMTYGLEENKKYTKFTIEISPYSKIVSVGSAEVILNIKLFRIVEANGVATYEPMYNAQNAVISVERVYAKPMASGLSRSEADRLAALIAANFVPQIQHMELEGNQTYFEATDEVVIDYRPASGIGVVSGRLTPKQSLIDEMSNEMLHPPGSLFLLAKADVTGKIKMKADSVSFSDSVGMAELILKYSYMPSDEGSVGTISLYTKIGYDPLELGKELNFTTAISIQLDMEAQVAIESLYDVIMDDEPTENSKNLVNSGGIYKFVTEAFTPGQASSFVTESTLHDGDHVYTGSNTWTGRMNAYGSEINIGNGSSKYITDENTGEKKARLYLPLPDPYGNEIFNFVVADRAWVDNTYISQTAYNADKSHTTEQISGLSAAVTEASGKADNAMDAATSAASTASSAETKADNAASNLSAYEAATSQEIASINSTLASTGKTADEALEEAQQASSSAGSLSSDLEAYKDGSKKISVFVIKAKRKDWKAIVAACSNDGAGTPSSKNIETFMDRCVGFYISDSEIALTGGFVGASLISITTSDISFRRNDTGAEIDEDESGNEDIYGKFLNCNFVDGSNYQPRYGKMAVDGQDVDQASSLIMEGKW